VRISSSSSPRAQGTVSQTGCPDPVLLKDIHIPVFTVSTIIDHSTPRRSVFKIQMLSDADVTFVLSNGGHNASIINPSGHPNRHHEIALAAKELRASLLCPGYLRLGAVKRKRQDF